MTEINNIVHIEELSNAQLENKQLEQIEQQYNETLEFINECNMSIFNFTKDNTNNVILKPKEKIIKKKYKLYQYNLNINEFIYIGKFTTFSEITKYLEKQDIHINLKTLIKNKLLKIELI